MPVEPWVLEHCKTVFVYLIGCNQYKTNAKKGHAKDNVEAMQSGDHIVETKENILPWLAVYESLWIRIDIMVDLSTPFKILIDEKDYAADKRKTN